MVDAHDIPHIGEVIHAQDITNILNNYVTTATFNSTIGDINSILDNINGEVVWYGSFSFYYW